MGKHAKKRTKTSGYAKAAGLTAGGVAASFAGMSQAQAATEEQWDAIAQCESGGNWSIDYSGDGLSVGGLQFQSPSWQAALDYLNQQGYDTSSWPQELYQGMPNVPGKYETVLAAEALLAIQGPGAWVCTGIGLDASMFEGGPTPAILSGGAPTPVPAPDPEPEVPVEDGGVAASEGSPSEVYDDHLHHTVEPGDTLYDISLKYLGDGHKWGRVYNVPETRAVVGANPHLIYPGQDIRVNASVNAQADVSEPIPADPIPVDPEPSDAADNVYVAPCDAPVGQAYGNMSGMYALGYHTGTDFSAPSGTEVVSVTGGVVIEPDSSSAYGTNVRVEHADGTYGLYAHLSGATVAPGDLVEAGQPVGYVGSTGNSSGPHLHMEIRNVPEFGDGNFLDPVQYLRDHGVVL